MKDSLSATVLNSSLDSRPRVPRNFIYIRVASDRYVVNDPQTGRYFCLSTPTVDIMKNLDGTQTLEELSVKLGLPEIALQYVADQLALLLLLEGYTPTNSTRRNWLRRCSALLLIRKDIITSDAWMDSVYQRLRLKYVLHPRLLVLLLCLYIVGGSIYIRYSSVLGQTMGQLLKEQSNRLSYLVAFFAIFIISAILHELAHGFACKRFGGKVRAIGIALYFFIPAFYCDVSDAWMFKQRYQCFITHAAGLMMNFFLCSLGLLLLPWTLHITWLRDIITINFFISGVYTLVNLNPLIRLDGYYILADALKINNLRRSSSDFLQTTIHFLLYKLHILKKRPLLQKRQQTWHTRCILLAYALASLGYQILLVRLLGESYARLLPGGIGPLWDWILCSLFFTLFIALPFWVRWRKHTQRKLLLQKYTSAELQ